MVILAIAFRFTEITAVFAGSLSCVSDEQRTKLSVLIAAGVSIGAEVPQAKRDLSVRFIVQNTVLILYVESEAHELSQKNN